MGCKVILLYQAGGLRFGLLPPKDGDGFFPIPFPDLMAIDRDLELFAVQELGLGAPQVHGRFVERPHPAGTIYYLVEEEAQPDSPAAGVLWLDSRAALERLVGEDRLALTRAIGYLSGQRFGQSTTERD